MFMLSGFQHLRTPLAEHFVATPEEMIYVEWRHFPFD